MSCDPKLSLDERLELDQLPEKIVRHEQARAVRVHVRQCLTAQIQEAQTKIVVSEDEARRRLPTPLTDEAIKVIAGYPEVSGRRHELKRLIEEFGPTLLEHTELVARAIEENDDAEVPTSFGKPGRKAKASGSLS